jgi:hypothetical protein
MMSKTLKTVSAIPICKPYFQAFGNLFRIKSEVDQQKISGKDISKTPETKKAVARSR